MDDLIVLLIGAALILLPIGLLALFTRSARQKEHV